MDVDITSKLYGYFYNVVVGQIGFYEPDFGSGLEEGIFYFQKDIQNLPHYYGDSGPRQWSFGNSVLKIKLLE